MPKFLWVLLPLLFVAALFALQWLRRGPPSRRTVNMVSSLLLLAYVGTTAGLGIFWVANQQLPVFDWHYLFGYATVLLVGLHLAFNFASAWRHLMLSSRAEAPGASTRLDDARSARRALGAVGVLLLTGLAFALGLRHGRSDLRVEAATDRADALAGGGEADRMALVERYHAHSSHSRTGVLLRAPGADWGDPPPAFKRYPQAERMALPSPGTSATAGANLAALATMLWHTAGVTEARGPIRLRAAPSSGALFSTELYVAAHDVAGLPRGLWHYDASAHALERLPGIWAHAASGASAEVIATALFRRSGHKYRDRTYRYVLADLGHALENLLVAAQALGVPARLEARFDESLAAAALGLDEAEEGVLAQVVLGGAALPAGVAPLQAPSPWQAASVPAGRTLALGVTGAMHAATSLRSGAAERAGGDPPIVVASPAEGVAVALPRPSAITADRLALIARRRSVRRYAPGPLPLEALAGVLAGLSAGSAARLSGALSVHVVAHDVAGLAAGVYRHAPAAPALLLRRRDDQLRAASQAAALAQDVIGDAAAVIVLSADRAAIAADPAGPARGYRHAFIEAGLVGERIYLEAGARGLAVCAVGAFYDDEAAALLGVDPAREWVLHFAALGLA